MRLLSFDWFSWVTQWYHPNVCGKGVFESQGTVVLTLSSTKATNTVFLLFILPERISARSPPRRMLKAGISLSFLKTDAGERGAGAPVGGECENHTLWICVRVVVPNHLLTWCYWILLLEHNSGNNIHKTRKQMQPRCKEKDAAKPSLQNEYD